MSLFLRQWGHNGDNGDINRANKTLRMIHCPAWSTEMRHCLLEHDSKIEESRGVRHSICNLYSVRAQMSVLSSHYFGIFYRSSIAIPRRSARLRLRDRSIRSAKSAPKYER